jgi:hypothetical protein
MGIYSAVVDVRKLSFIAFVREHNTVSKNASMKLNNKSNMKPTIINNGYNKTRTENRLNPIQFVKKNFVLKMSFIAWPNV